MGNKDLIAFWITCVAITTIINVLLYVSILEVNINLDKIIAKLSVLENVKEIK